MDFLSITFPEDLEYSSDSHPLPLEFYLEVFPRSKTAYLKLGYFSSSAIKVLAFGFAEFIFNGGEIKIITNHFLNDQDRDLVDFDEEFSDESNEVILHDLRLLKESLTNEGQHFFNCLKCLVKEGRLEVIPVMLKPERMVHYKQGVFEDNNGNQIFSDGSCNFTANGLLENGESISVYRSWGGDLERTKIASKSANIYKIINREDDNYIYLKKEQVLNAIDSIGFSKDIYELISDERNMISSLARSSRYSSLLKRYEDKLQERIVSIELEPRFPFNSQPREYQRMAYKKWKENNYKGIFAMATGTGKTITSLNCVLEEYKVNEFYQAIVLVPTATLLNQWEEEVLQFNFTNIILASSKYDWKSSINELTTYLAFDKSHSFIIVSTYKTFCNPDFIVKAKKLPKTTVLIADEAHNIGAKQVKAAILECKFEKRIGLSATPKRIYDPEGNALIEDYFNSIEPYTYSFSMERAIREGILCQYYYYPRIVFLTDVEMEKYAEITKELVKYFDFSTMSYREGTKAEILLLQRKRIIHKAENKLFEFRNIIESRDKDGGLNYSFVYVPEGKDEQGQKLIKTYLDVLSDVNRNIKAYAYIHQSENKAQVMAAFESGQIDSIFSMKCLDEGVDIPRAQLAIFCSSTGNPRQFIQRRGRILRNHPDKEYAEIYDLVVFPKPGATGKALSLERNMIRNELTRVVYFASLAQNYYQAMGDFKELAGQYDLDLFALEMDLGVNDE